MPIYIKLSRNLVVIIRNYLMIPVLYSFKGILQKSVEKNSIFFLFTMYLCCRLVTLRN